MAAKKVSAKGVEAKKTIASKSAATVASRNASVKATQGARSKASEAVSEAGRRVDVGDAFPEVILQDQSGAAFSLASLRGKPAIVYFYPKDDTPGCTREACGFQEQLSAFTKLQTRVIGVSPDPVSRHEKFAGKYGLKFTLLADPDRKYADACGVLVPKTLYGRTSIGVERTTFLLDRDGVVRKVWRKVKVDGHVDAVKEAIRTALPK